MSEYVRAHTPLTKRMVTLSSLFFIHFQEDTTQSFNEYCSVIVTSRGNHIFIKTNLSGCKAVKHMLTPCLTLLPCSAGLLESDLTKGNICVAFVCSLYFCVGFLWEVQCLKNTDSLIGFLSNSLSLSNVYVFER